MVPVRIAEAQKAILGRVRELFSVETDHIEEDQILDDALYALRAVTIGLRKIPGNNKHCVVLSLDTKKPPVVLRTAIRHRVGSTGGFFCLQNHELFRLRNCVVEEASAA